MNNLTNEQKARVFAMYIGATYRIEYVSITDKRKKYANYILTPFGLYTHMEIDNAPAYTARLLLRPLSAITDEDAIEVAKIGGQLHSEEERMIWLGKQLIEIWFFSSRCNVQGIEWWAIFQYLRSKGYALPEYFAPGHPDNGKTAIELGLAIDITTTR